MHMGIREDEYDNRCARKGAEETLIGPEPLYSIACSTTRASQTNTKNTGRKQTDRDMLRGRFKEPRGQQKPIPSVLPERTCARS